MASINLLPWREEQREERQKQFITILVSAFIFAALTLYAAMFAVDSRVAEQHLRNGMLETEISSLEGKIQEISKLGEKREQLVARMDVIQSLQSSRPEIVRIFDSLVRVLPDGIYLDKIERREGDFILNGIAQSNARVSVFMQKLEEHPDFEEPKLQVVQRTATNNEDIRKFTLLIRDVKEPEGDNAMNEDVMDEDI